MPWSVCALCNTFLSHADIGRRSQMACATFGQLAEGCTQSIEAMVCRKWDVFTRKGTYISTDFVLSDAQGNRIHCTAKSSVAHCFINKLDVGCVYNIKSFNVVPNKKTFTIVNNNTYMLELHGGSIVKHVQVPNNQFHRYPFDLTEIEDIRLSDCNALLEVIGYVTVVGVSRSVGTPSKQNTISKTLDFRLLSNTGAHVRVTLWDGLGDELTQLMAAAGDLFAVILVGMHVKEFRGEVYISSTPSTMIYDSADIPHLAEFRRRPIVEVVHIGLPADSGVQSMKMDIIQMLNWCREKKRDMVFHCAATIVSIADQTPWYYFACTTGKCKKGVTRRGGNFFCTSCELPVSFPKARFKLRLNIQDSTATTAVTLFDDTAEKLVGATADSLLKADDTNDDSVMPNGLSNIINTVHTLEIKSHTYYSVGSESFTCTNILPASTSPVQKRPRQDDPPAFASSAVACSDIQSSSGGAGVLNQHDKANKKNQPDLFPLTPERGDTGYEPILTEAQKVAQSGQLYSTVDNPNPDPASAVTATS